MKINRKKDVPPPVRSAEAFGGPALGDTVYLFNMKSYEAETGGNLQWPATCVNMKFHFSVMTRVIEMQAEHIRMVGKH